MIRILESAELTFQKNILSVLDRFIKERRNICDIRANHFAILHTGFVKLLFGQKRLVIEVLEKHIFLRAYIL